MMISFESLALNIPLLARDMLNHDRGPFIEADWAPHPPMNSSVRPRRDRTTSTRGTSNAIKEGVKLVQIVRCDGDNAPLWVAHRRQVMCSRQYQDYLSAQFQQMTGVDKSGVAIHYFRCKANRNMLFVCPTGMNLFYYTGDRVACLSDARNQGSWMLLEKASEHEGICG